VLFLALRQAGRHSSQRPLPEQDDAQCFKLLAASFSPIIYELREGANSLSWS